VNDIEYPPGPREQQEFVFLNKNAHNIRITHFHFESSKHPRDWDTHEDEVYIDRDGGMCAIDIWGPGRIFLKWNDNGSDRADTFEVQFRADGVPYPYIFGGDRWEMALRHKAMLALKKHGNN
jgi:hypothetical protein